MEVKCHSFSLPLSLSPHFSLHSEGNIVFVFVICIWRRVAVCVLICERILRVLLVSLMSYEISILSRNLIISRNFSRRFGLLLYLCWRGSIPLSPMKRKRENPSGIHFLSFLCLSLPHFIRVHSLSIARERKTWVSEEPQCLQMS
jgi:hypothetical protein